MFRVECAILDLPANGADPIIHVEVESEDRNVCVQAFEQHRQELIDAGYEIIRDTFSYFVCKNETEMHDVYIV